VNSTPSSRIRDVAPPAWVDVAPGVRTRTLVEGNGTALLIYEIGPGVRLATHEHGFPEFGVMLSGRAHLDIGGDERDIREGDSYYTPAHLPHGFYVPPDGPPAVVLDVSVTSHEAAQPVVPRLLQQVQGIVTRGPK